MLLLENAIIHPMRASSNTNEDTFTGSILAKDGKIMEVSSQLTLPDSADCERIDVNHQHVYPGFIEAHCHMGITEEKKGKARG